MNTRHSLAAAAFALTAALSLSSSANAGFDFDRDFNISFGNGFNVTFGGNGRNVFRQADRVIRSDRFLRREVNDLPFNRRFALLQLSSQVNQRTNQLVLAVRNDNRQLIRVRARQLVQTINEMEVIVDRLPRGSNEARDVRRAFDNLEDNVRDLLRTLR